MTLPHPALRPIDGELPEFREPLAIAAFWGWNDGLATATSAIRYLREEWDATEVASVDPDCFYDLSVARPRRRRDGDQSTLRWPGIRFHAASPPAAGRDVLTISGREPALRWRELCEAIGSVLEAVGAKQLLLLGSRGGLVPHTRPAPVTLSEGGAYFEQLLGLPSEQRTGYQGPTGINTAIMLDLGARGIDVARLTVRVPSYINAGPNPRAVLALTEVLDRALGSGTRLGALSDQVAAFEEQASEALGRVEDPRALRDQIADMEREYDQTHALEPPRSPELPQAESLLDEIDRMLRGERGEEDPGPPEPTA